MVKGSRINNTNTSNSRRKQAVELSKLE